MHFVRILKFHIILYILYIVYQLIDCVVQKLPRHCMLVVRIDSTAFSFPLSPRFMSSAGDAHGTLILWTVAVLACLMGLHLVASVGGGDMHLGKKTHFSTVGLRVGP